MYIHKLHRGGNGKISGHHKKTGGAGKVATSSRKTIGSCLGELDKIYEDGRVKKATETLRGLRVSKPRVPKKYISLD
jgi:hypothetical protein